MEVTLRTSAAGDAIAAVAGSVPEMLIGVGTVLNSRQCELAVQKGASFPASPALIRTWQNGVSSHKVPLISGCVTPSEIMAAYAMGIRIFKFFPANVYGGLAALKSTVRSIPGRAIYPHRGRPFGESLGLSLRAMDSRSRRKRDLPGKGTGVRRSCILPEALRPGDFNLVTVKDVEKLLSGDSSGRVQR